MTTHAASPAIADVTAAIVTNTTQEQSRWTFSRAGARERVLAEDFIRQGFASAYGARLGRLMPALMVLWQDERIAAACGLRAAGSETLFLETYLDQPVEAVLSRTAGVGIRRADIVEVGNLVIARAGYARRLIVHLTAHLRAAGTAWVVFTAVPALRNSFRRIGIPLLTLAAADSGRLPTAARAEWGDYYEQAPVVTAVEVSAAFAAVCEAACTR